MATAKLKPAEEGTEEAPKSRKKQLLIVVPVLLVIAAAAYFFLAPGGDEEKKTEAAVAGAVVPLESITVNLADGHYLKLKLALQATAEAGDEVEGSKALDLAVSQFSNRGIEELTSDKARNQLKADLLKKIEKAYDHHVMDIYFTEFVMQ